MECGIVYPATAEARAHFLVIKVSESRVSESPMLHHIIYPSSNTYDLASMPLSKLTGISIGAARITRADRRCHCRGKLFKGCCTAEQKAE